ncbi:hypothetical protein [Candidatus Doolittlea endobia]
MLYRTDELGRSKTEIAQRQLKALNPYSRYVSLPQ